MSDTAIGYTRLSQNSDTSIDRQKSHIKAYCSREGFDLLEIYDDGEQSSGFDTGREEYQHVREHIQAGDVDAVVVNDKRRLARDIDEVMRLIPDLRTSGVELHTHQDGRLDLSDPMRAAIEILMAAAAHEEKMQEIEKAIEATKERRENGCYQGHPPFGLTFDEDGCHLLPNQNFETVRDIFFLKRRAEKTHAEVEEVTGVSTSTISRILKRQELYEKYGNVELPREPA